MYSFEIITTLSDEEFDKVWTGSYQNLVDSNFPFSVFDAGDDEASRKNVIKERYTTALSDSTHVVYKITKDDCLIVIAFGMKPEYQGGVFKSVFHLFCNDNDSSKSYIHDTVFLDNYKEFINGIEQSTVFEIVVPNNIESQPNSYIRSLADSYGKKATDFIKTVFTGQVELTLFQYVLWTEADN